MKKVTNVLKNRFGFDRLTAAISGLFAFLLSLSYVLGYQLEKYNMTLPGFSGKSKIFLFSLLLTIPFSLITYILFSFLKKTFTVKKCRFGSGKIFLFSFAFIMMCRIPVLLAYYPAVMSYDFGRQLSEAMNGHVWFWDYQPLIHTELIRIFYLIGVKLGSIETGMALLSILQITVVSAIMAYTVSLIGRVSGRIWLCVLFCLIYALLPLNELISVIMTKDVFFAGFFVLFICLIYERTLKKSLLLEFGILVVAILNIMFRKNSVYAMIFLVIAYLIYEKKISQKIMSSALIIICVISGILCHKAMVEGFDVIRGNNTEMYSVPMMQFMRTYTNQKDNLTPEQIEMLNKVLPLEASGIGYDPYCADSVKNYSGMRSEIWAGSPKAFAHEWVTLFKAYPNEFIDAFLFLNKGYWYLPDRVFAEVFGVGAENGKGLLHTYNHTYEVFEGGIKDTCYFPPLRKFYEYFINENGFFNWPVLNLLFRPAFYFWLLILSVAAAMIRKNRLGLILLTYPLLYTGTLFFGPLVYIRYMYPQILTVPVIFVIILFTPRRVNIK